ncbi:MAG: double-strand break repair helicase AddA [Roseitalea sp.]|jgi:ATP-dependent helicase/nuclease subunit A|nr:double-strand break repair helicase AddA [Roseitalea sp.]MBO6743054.1 double-strand break repair helicase AddA [Roseitalea sp.]
MAKPLPDQRTRADQARAADPANSAWVSANAGSGKTWVLSTRVIRILLSGTDPSKILCLTYTRAAAAEMKTRVFQRLGAWVAMDDAALGDELAAITGERPGPEALAFARTLFARALETPGGLKIQTIHAFCESLLHRFPLEANIAGHFELLDAEAQALLVAQARRGLLADAAQRGEAGAAVMRLLAIAGESGVEKLLDEIVGRRIAVTGLLQRLSPAEDRREAYRVAFGFAPDETEADIARATWPLPGFDGADLDQLEAAAARAPKSPRKTHLKFIAKLRDAMAEPDALLRLLLLAKAFLKADGMAATHNMFPADISDALPAFETDFLSAADRIADARNRLDLLREIEGTLDVLAVADALIGRYEALKRARGLLDFEDLIARTATLLMRTGASLWVRYKLDQGIDHILIDEAQDTSPAQWDVIRTLADEFFAGDAARTERRTVFAVGDEKQSIYSFQGADPDRFAGTRAHFAERAGEADRPFAPVELQVSFRSTEAVLAAVDHVFAVDGNRAGLTRDGLPTAHRSLRQGEPGRVEIWEQVAKQRSDPSEDWTAPVDAIDEPSLRVATRIAETIRDWIETGAVLEATGQPIAPDDILVLVRSRDGFVNALSRALKDRGVPVAGADRLTLTGHIAVLDLIALGRVMLNRADDLSLAALLKSPLFGCADDDLFALAHGREGATLWSRLVEAGRDDAAHAAIAEQLADWANKALHWPLHEFYAHVLSVCSGREKLIGRLGPETADVLDEFMALTLAAERTGPPALETFLNTLDLYAPEIKREMDQAKGEVRIMTVHGAKGLEAPIVFLVDRGSAPFDTRQAPALLPVDLPGETGSESDALLWRGMPDARSDVHAASLERLERAAQNEYRRLLYVGMTRAADRLIIAGYRGIHVPSGLTWHGMALSALEPHCDMIETGDGPVWQFPTGLGAVPTAARAARNERERPFSLPKGFVGPAAAEPPAARPLVPSGASGLAIAPEAADAVETGSVSLLDDGGGTPGGSAARRGTLIHTLLQMLPAIEPDDRHQRARQWCAMTAPGMETGEVDALLAQVFGVLDDPRHAALFTPASIAEVSVMGTLDLGGEERAVSGVIDRLAVAGDAVLIVDYKTGRHVPETPDAISEAHARQMALYKALVAPLYPGKTVRALLLLTAGPAMIEIPDERLASALAGLAQS